MAKSNKRTSAQTPQPALSARAARFQGNLEIVITAVAMLAIFIMINYVGKKYYIRKDLSPSRYYEISEKTRNVLKNLPSPVNVVVCMTDQKSELHGQVLALLKEYKDIAGDKLTIEDVDPVLGDKSIVEALAETFNFRGNENVVAFQMRARIGDAATTSRSKVVYEGDIATYNSPLEKNRAITEFRAEQQFTGAIQSLIEDKPARVYFLEGHGERSISDIGGMGSAGGMQARLARESIEPVPLSLIGSPKVPDDASALVIAGPQNRLHPDEVAAIGAYLENRGKVFLMQDPGVTSGLETMIQRYQIALHNDVVKRPTDSPGKNRAIVTVFADHPASRSFRGKAMIIPNIRSMRLLDGPDGQASPRVTYLMETQADNYGETNFTQSPSRLDEGSDKAGPLTVAAAYSEGDIPGETQTGARLVVIGSSTYLLATADSAALGTDFFLNCLNWMLHREYANGITSKKPMEYPMGVTPLQESTINWLSLLVVPLITMSLGLFIWYSRRR
ncbi:hypothetical protein DB346_04935 [Verrucomicrobia bacterium LW23]|nr:hypothetical protein DB346_04935 [Verrucomicrobia bacterium LW23]